MCALVTGVQTCALPISSFIRTVRKRAASNRRLRHRTGSADLPRPAKDSQTAEALAGSRVASWRRRAYRRWGISPRPEDVLLWWIEIGRAHVRTPVPNAHIVCRLLLEKKKKKQMNTE